jgi:hypothetical protein
MNVQWEHDLVDKNKLTSLSVNILSKKDKINPLGFFKDLGNRSIG